MNSFYQSFFFVILSICTLSVNGQHSVAREWNELLLEAIRDDYARPTVHARNLFHTGIAMYDAWAVFDNNAETYLLGKQLHNYKSTFDGFSTTASIESARKSAINYAVYRLLSYRFSKSPHQEETQLRFDKYMGLSGYDINYNSTDYSSGDPRALGNFIASQVIEFGLIDGANELSEYSNKYYEPVNEPILPEFPGNPDILYPNRWQPIALEVFIDQSGNVIEGGSSPFLSPEWGLVTPFSLTSEDLTIHQRDGNEYWVYMDPGPPPFIDTAQNTISSEQYKWNFELVSIWSSHLDPGDSVKWDISPGAIGNILSYPESREEYSNFYRLNDGGDIGLGHNINPVTNKPYEEQFVPRGDYSRVLAEFWADGPDSETPPGHWFTILNYVSDHPLLEKRFKGDGPVLDDLEWDVKAYFILGSAMHDAAVVSWGIKGYYDYLRPVSAIRYLADNGQCTDPELPNYDKNGINLIPGLIELVYEDDSLAGEQLENLYKVKVLAWKGPDYIENPFMDEAGVDWILAENWWPYQRPSFVSPPFAGYISGHSTYSRTAAEVLTLLTGSKYFPGGMGEFVAKKDEFLVFEDGPSVDVTLQWATYQDASDQCSLSRIWGGIHPPADDIPGRLIGIELGPRVFAKAEDYFTAKVLHADASDQLEILVYPNPIVEGGELKVLLPSGEEKITVSIHDLNGKELNRKTYDNVQKVFTLDLGAQVPGLYLLRLTTGHFNKQVKLKVE